LAYSKRAQYLDGALGVLFIILLGIGMVMVYSVISPIFDSFTSNEEDYTEASREILTETQNDYPRVFDAASLAVVAALYVAGIITTMSKPMTPTWFILIILFTLGIAYGAAITSNVWEFFSTTSMGENLVEFPITNWVLNNQVGLVLAFLFTNLILGVGIRRRATI
jgi:hypothetical protein